MVKLLSFDFNFWLPVSLISPEKSRKIIKEPSLERIPIDSIAPLQVFISSLIPAQKHLMKTAKPEDKECQNDTES